MMLNLIDVRRTPRRTTSKILNYRNGFIFLEVLVAVALIGIVFVVLLGIGFLSLNVSFSAQKTTQIDFLLKEEIEAARSFRDSTTWAVDGLGAVTTDTPYYFILDNGTNPPHWSLASGTEIIGSFTRSVVFNKGYRDANDNLLELSPVPGPFCTGVTRIKKPMANIAFAAATCVCEGEVGCDSDSDTVKVTAKIVFGGKTYQVVTYLTNWKQ